MSDNYAEKIAKAEQDIDNGNYGDAMTALIEIIDEDPNAAVAYNCLGFIAWKQSRWQDAFVLFREAVNLDNSNEDYLNNLLDASFKLHKIDDMAPVFEKAALDNPENDDITIIHKAITDPENDIYKSARALDIGYWHPLIEKGEYFIKNGEYIEALKAFIEHADTVGGCAEVYNGLGIVQFNAKEYYEAFLMFFESLKINPLNGDVFLNLFDSAVECGQEETALQIYEILSAEYPQLEQMRGETEILKKK
ncbi:MAG: tetratricopeptide repeat protein [Chitinivibrionia bacterium]|nr:tetratricopeptide repeat protein [Chitinivibrionia bacterium]